MIKPFLNRVLIFLGILMVFTLGLLYSVHKMVDGKAEFKLNNEIKYLFLGHSHSECALNDSLISNSKNLSESGESYFYTYQKIKKLLPQNPSITHVLVEFSNNQIEEVMNDWIWDDKHISYMLPRYAPFINLEDHILLIQNNYSSYYNYSGQSLRNDFTRISNNDYNFSHSIGGYRWLKRDKIDSLLTTVNKEKIDQSTSSISIKNIDYLQKIVRFCRNQQVQICLIRSPQHQYYPDRYNEETFAEIRQKNFSTIDFLDFNNFPCTNNEFGDFGHLNYKGAHVFSSWFNQIIKNGLLSNTNKQTLIEQELKNFSR